MSGTAIRSRSLLAGVLEPGKLALFLARQQPTVADRPDVQLQGIVELARRLIDLLDISLRSKERLHEATYRLQRGEA